MEKGKSQINYMIGFVDRVGGKCPVAWKSKVGRRVVRSTIEAEVINLGEVLEMVVFLKEVWREISSDILEIIALENR